MKDLQIEVSLPGELLKKYQKSPRVYSNDNEFLGHDLAYSRARSGRYLSMGLVVVSFGLVDILAFGDGTYGSVMGVISSRFLLGMIENLRESGNTREMLVRR